MEQKPLVIRKKSARQMSKNSVLVLKKQSREPSALKTIKSDFSTTFSIDQLKYNKYSTIEIHVKYEATLFK